LCSSTGEKKTTVAVRGKLSSRSSKPAGKPGEKRRDPLDAKIPLTKRDRIAGNWFAKLVALQARLRAPGGCPWDREQTHETLRKFLVEETYEVLDAMESGDPHKFSSELGDLLLQIVFHSILAEEKGTFTIADVIETVHRKMVRRHPHVFGEVKARTSADVLKNWEQLKAVERAEEDTLADADSSGEKPTPSGSILAGIAHSLPAVLEADQLTQRASRVGFDWDDLPSLLAKLEEERRELESLVENPLPGASKDAAQPSFAKSPQLLEEEVGDLLFVAANIARFLGVDPEIALKKANRKFKRRFEWMESAAAREGQRFAEVPRARMEELWNESKANT
jgi:MazG family protein